MELKLFATVFGAIFIAEMADKTQTPCYCLQPIKTSINE
jgi:putative Ca2+/H+ antiporter (TMEM165/GDT1 family)